MRRIHIDPYAKGTRTRWFKQNIRTEWPYVVDWTSVVAARSGVTAVSSVEWKSVGSRDATITGKDLTSDVASALIASLWGGYTQVRCEATFDDGNTMSVYIDITFEDPEYR